MQIVSDYTMYTIFSELLTQLYSIQHMPHSNGVHCKVPSKRHKQATKNILAALNSSISKAQESSATFEDRFIALVTGLEPFFCYLTMRTITKHRLKYLITATFNLYDYKIHCD